MKVLIDILDRDLKTLVFQPLKPLPKVNVENLIKILQQGVIIPENATNGDVIKAMFPNATIDSTFDNEKLNEELGLIIIKGMDNGNVPFYKEWWNAPYKKGVEE